MDLQKLKSLFAPTIPWEIDFRDSTIVSKAAFRSIKLILTISCLAITTILSVWCGFNFLRYQSKAKDLSDISAYIASNEKIAEANKKINKQFIEEKNQIFAVFANYNTGFSTYAFLKDLMKNKADVIKFSTIVIQDNKDYSSNAEKTAPNFSIQLYGSLNDDVSYLDTYKEAVLMFPSLKDIKQCQSFIQFDQNQKSFNAKEIKFQLMVQSNG